MMVNHFMVKKRLSYSQGIQLQQNYFRIVMGCITTSNFRFQFQIYKNRNSYPIFASISIDS